MKNIAIIGAGPMGLSLAYYLNKKGNCNCTVFERNGKAGGMSESFDFDGTTIEKYYHFINRPDDILFGLLDELNLLQNLKWVNTKMGFFRYSPDDQKKGILYRWGTPLSLFAVRGISLLSKLRYALHVYSCKFLKDLSPLDKLSAKEWISKSEGKDGYKQFWSFLFDKKFFELSDPLSAAWIASRIRRVANSRDSILKESLGYLEGGTESFINSLLRDLYKHNGKLLCNEQVISVFKDDDNKITVKSENTQQQFDKVFFTIPLQYISSIIKNLPEEYRNSISKVNNIGCACVLFRLDKALTDNFWLNVDMPQWDIPGVIEYSNLRPMKKTFVYVPFYMPKTHINWELDDNAILDKARNYLKQINKDAMDTEEAAKVFRYEYAQPVCQPDFINILPKYETGIDNLYAADTAHSFPEDRSLNESIRIAQELSMLADQ